MTLRTREARGKDAALSVLPEEKDSVTALNYGISLFSREILDSMWEIELVLVERRHFYNHHRLHGNLASWNHVEFANDC